VLSFTPGAGSTGTLSGTLMASPNLTYTVEIFSDSSALAAGQEQGRAFLKDVTVRTDSSGKGTFSLTEPIGYYAATATDPWGETPRRAGPPPGRSRGQPRRRRSRRHRTRRRTASR